MLLHVQVSNREFHLCIGKQNYHVIVQYPVPDIGNVNKRTVAMDQGVIRWQGESVNGKINLNYNIKYLHKS